MKKSPETKYAGSPDQQLYVQSTNQQPSEAGSQDGRSTMKKALTATPEGESMRGRGIVTLIRKLMNANWGTQRNVFPREPELSLEYQ
jgi:hypothetical protein